MRTGRDDSMLRSKLLALAVALSILLDALTKAPGQLQEMLWSCHWAAAAIAMGFAFGWRLPIAAGTLFFAALGLPAWGVGVLFLYEFHPTSMLIHVVPPLAGWFALRERREVPAGTVWLAFALLAAPTLIGYWFTDPALNVNLAHSIWPPVEHWFEQLWTFHAAVGLIAVGLLWLGANLMSWLLGAGGASRTAEA